MVHHPGMHCAPDVNRAMRPGENLLDIQKGIAVHRLIGFQSFRELVGTLEMLKGQVGALLQRHCLLAARTGDETEPLDSRRFFWSVDAFADAVNACRGHAPRVSSDGDLRLDFFFFGGGLPVAGYHKDRKVPLQAEPNSRAARWPEWMEELRYLKDCDGSPEFDESESETTTVQRNSGEITWKAFWRSAAPRLSRLQVEASGYEALAANAEVEESKVKESFEKLESSGDSWLQELKKFGKSLKKLHHHPGRRWIFIDFSPSSTFLNIFESLRVLRIVSGLYHSQSSTRNVYLEDVRGPVDLGAVHPPPLALAYEYFDLNVEQASGLWLNGVALQRIIRCQPLRHPIKLDPEAHANDWETEEDRIALMWHNAIAIDIFRALRFCGVVLLHAPSMAS